MNGLLGIALPKGEYEVVLRFSDPLVNAGIVVTLITLVALAALALRKFRQWWHPRAR